MAMDWKRKKMGLLLLIAIAGLFFFFILIKIFSHLSENKNPQVTLPSTFEDRKERVIKKVPPMKKQSKKKEKKEKKRKPATSSPPNKKKYHPKKKENVGKDTRQKPQPPISLADIAYYDSLQKGYVLKKSDLFGKKDFSRDLLSSLKILNKKNMSQDYYQSHEYESAYNEIDTYYSDTYIWPYFSNREAKENFFFYLFTRYSADNKKWRSYEKDISDCTQFSQRIYFLLSPGEILLKNEKYFYFLFSQKSNREERKKLCNKIPNIFYATIKPYLLKKDRSKPPATGHAMICFSPNNSLQEMILAEPQTGAFEKIEGDSFRDLLDSQLTNSPSICRLGKITTIAENKEHEALTKDEGAYLFPGTHYYYEINDPRLHYEETPILLQGLSYGLFRIISSYVEKALNNYSSGHSFLHTLDSIMRQKKLPLNQMESALESSIDIIMHGLLDLEPSDLKRVRDEINNLNDIIDSQINLSPPTKKLASQLHYLMLLKLKPFLE